MARALLVLTLLVAGACTQRNPEYCDRDEDCGDGEACALAEPFEGLTHVCRPTGGGGVDAPLVLVDGRVADAAAPDAAAPDAAVPCPDAGSCPAHLPICRGGLCSPCSGATECPNPGAPVCTVGGACAPCGDDDQCAMRTATPRCLSGSCVECDRPADCAQPDRPVCDGATGACRKCAADDECAELCDTATGRCVAAGDIVRVAEGGTGDCLAAPCGSITLALTKVTGTRRWVRLAAGTYREWVTVSGQTVALVGSGAATTTIEPGGAPNVPALNVSGGSDVTLRRLRLANATGDAGATGVTCAGTPTPRLTMSEVRVEDNDAVGVVANPCVLDIRRSRILGNDGGGVRIVASSFSMLNNVIAVNGSAFATVGGVRILDDPPAARFEFNTVAGNTTVATATSGVACDGLTAPLGFSNSIVAGNTNTQIGGCTWTYSAIPGGSGTNIGGDPLFVNAEGRNFDLMPSSPAINAANPAASSVTDDIDGGTRPLGGRADMGAYEVR